MTEVKSLKNPQRILTALMFMAFLVYSLGAEQLAQIFPSASQATITVVVAAATYLVTQYGTEARVVRAEDKKEAEILNDLEDDLSARED